jgi:hypothetical protein
MEIQRTQVSADLLAEYCDDLGAFLNGIRSELVSNMDETGQADWSDAHPDPIHVSQDYLGATTSSALTELESL